MTPQEYLNKLLPFIRRCAEGVGTVKKDGKDSVKCLLPLEPHERKSLLRFIQFEGEEITESVQAGSLSELVSVFAPDPKWKTWAELQSAADNWEIEAVRLLQSIAGGFAPENLQEIAARISTRKTLQSKADEFSKDLPAFSVKSLDLLRDEIGEDGSRKKGLLSFLSEASINPTGEFSPSAPWASFVNGMTKKSTK